MGAGHQGGGSLAFHPEISRRSKLDASCKCHRWDYGWALEANLYLKSAMCACYANSKRQNVASRWPRHPTHQSCKHHRDSVHELWCSASAPCAHLAQPYSTILVSPGLHLPFFGCQFPDKTETGNSNCSARPSLSRRSRGIRESLAHMCWRK